MKNRLRKAVVSLLLVVMIMASNIPVAEAAYITSNIDGITGKKTVTYKSHAAGEMAWLVLTYYDTFDADTLYFDGVWSWPGGDDSEYSTIKLNGTDFDTIKTWYKNFEHLKISHAELALNEIPAQTFYYSFGAGHGLKNFEATGTTIDLVGDYAFHHCHNLTDFSSTDAIETIGVGAFSYCTSLPYIDLEGTQKISDRAFYEDTSLRTVRTNGSLTYIGNYAFYNNNALTDFTSINTTTLGDYAFAESDVLRVANFTNLERVGYAAFQNCVSLKTAWFPSVTYVDDYAFYNNTSLESVTMPKLQTIDPCAFQNNTSLESLSIPRLTTIGNNAFEGCTNLRSLTPGAVPPTVGANAFNGLPVDRKIYIPFNSRIAYDSADGVMDNKWYGWNLPPLSTEADVLSFSFDEFSPRVEGHIANTNWIWFTVPYGTDVSSLVPTIQVSPLATVSPASGVAQDFSGTSSNNQADLFHYTVRAQNGSTTKHYYVRVTEAPSDEKDITSFTFDGGNIVGIVNEENKTVNFDVEHDRDVTSLTPTITISDDATISPASGVAQDFTSPVEYTVTALDGSTKVYTVKANIANNAPTIKSGVVNDKTIVGALNTSFDLDLSTIFEDDDGDSLTYYLYFDDGSNQTYNEVTENYTFTPTVKGQYQFSFTANDGFCDTRMPYNLTLAVANTEPSRKSGVPETANESIEMYNPYGLDLTTIFEDVDGDSLTYYVSLDNGNSYTAITSNSGLYVYAPSSIGETTHQFKANDGVSDSQDIYNVILDTTASSNSRPNRKAGIPAQITTSMDLGEVYTLDLSSIFEDADGDPLQFIISENGAPPTRSNDPVYTFTPSQTGLYDIMLGATDGRLNSTDQCKILLTVNPAPVNTPPNIKAGLGTSRLIDHIINTEFALDMSTIFEDIDGDTIGYEVRISGGSYDDYDTDSDFTYTPTSTGIKLIEMFAYDDDDTSETYNIFINCVNAEEYNTIPNRMSTVPVAVTDSIEVSSSYTLDLSTIFEDADNDALSYKVSINGANEITASQNFSYIPHSAGVTNLRFRANDGKADSTDTYYVQLTATSAGVSPLTGTVTITDDGSAQYGETLIANISATNNSGSLTYQWKRGTVDIGINSNQYIITEDDIGENLTVEITSDVESGTLTSSNTIIPAKADYVGAVTAPVEVSHAHNNVILDSVAGYEYKEINSDWQSSNAFTGLTPDTDYTFTQRVMATNTHNPSTTSSAITIRTGSLPANALTGTVTITGNAVYGEELTTSLSGTNELGTLTYQWQADGIDIINATSNTYTLTENEIGKVITIEVRDSDIGNGTKDGYIESAATSSIDKATPNTPNAPTKESSTTSSITLKLISNYEYRCNGGAWQNNNIFSGLTAGTSYNFTQRIKETNTAYESDESNVATFSTTSSSNGGGGGSSSGGSSTKTVVVNEYSTEIPSSYIGKDKVFEVESDKVKVNVNGLSLSQYKGDDVEIFIQRIDTDYFNHISIGDFPIGIPVFDISLIVDGVKVPFSTDIPLEIEIEVEGDYENHKMVAIYLADDGSYEILEGVYDGEKLTFKTYHLSNFALMYIDKSFDDITNHWGKESIEALASREVVNGIGNGLFNPNGEITRAEFTTIMVRYFDLTSKRDDIYSDVEEGKWYTDYIAIAKGNDILPEIYGDTFEPNEAITREEMIYILFKSLEVSDRLDTLEDNGDSLYDFTDSDMVSGYAIESCEYLIGADVINGSGHGKFKPTSTSTRAEVAQMMWNLITS